MDVRRIDNWSGLCGANVEIRIQGVAVCSGLVDAVTDDGRILWIRPPGNSRRLYEKAEFYEAWAAEDRIGFHYRVSNSPRTNAPRTSSPSGARVASLHPTLPAAAR